MHPRVYPEGKLKPVDDRPAPFQRTGRTRRTEIHGRPVVLREYLNCDGVTVWSSHEPKRRPKPSEGRNEWRTVGFGPNA